jgi:anthranilate phosphoribosyltransferase
MTIQEAIKLITAGKSLSITQSSEIFNEIMTGGATDAQIAAFIVAMHMKGETPEEITGAATVMREKATHVVPNDPRYVVDTCGTGGDGAHTFNISTTAAFVVAGAGARVAKHGNRSVSSKCGSADVLESLGVNISVNPAIMKQCLDEAGICFLFAPSLHKAMKYAIGPRKEIGIRTIFNILGPLTNPSLAKSQLLGVFSDALTVTMATALNNLGSRRAFVVHGADGLDEITTSAETHIAEVANGAVCTYTIQPEDFGVVRTPLSALAGGTSQENAATIRDILGGKKGPQRDIVVLNAGFAIAASGIAKDPKEGVAMAQKAIDEGKAMEKLEQLKKITMGAKGASIQ